jgi:hypothetical protein
VGELYYFMESKFADSGLKYKVDFKENVLRVTDKIKDFEKANPSKKGEGWKTIFDSLRVMIECTTAEEVKEAYEILTVDNEELSVFRLKPKFDSV